MVIIIETLSLSPLRACAGGSAVIKTKDRLLLSRPDILSRSLASRLMGFCVTLFGHFVD